MALDSTAIITLAALRRHLKVGQAAIASSPAPSTSGATLTASANGFVVGGPITIVQGGVDRLVTITDIVDNAIAWTPSLASAPSAGDAVYDSAGDAILEDIINAVSAEFERETGRYVIKRTGIVETRHGDGRSVLALRRRPVATLTSIAIAGETLSTDDYVADPDTGIVRLKAKVFPVGVGNVVVTYDAGYVLASVPSDIAMFVRQWCKYVYDEWHNDAVAAQSVSIGNQTFQIKPGLPDHLRKGIARWVDHRVW